MDIFYRVAPSWSDGYTVRVQLDNRPMVHAYVEKLKYGSPEQDLNWGKEPVPSHRPVDYPRVIMEESDVSLLGRTLVSIRVPLVSNEGGRAFDGTLYHLVISGNGCDVGLTWGNSLPKELAKVKAIAQVLDKYARKSLT